MSSILKRREILKLGIAAGMGMAPALGRATTLVNSPSRQVSLHNLHTGESLKTVYWEEGSYIPDALSEVNHVLRDFRTGDVHPIDPRLLDLLTRLSSRAGANAPFQVISGYRSPVTNAALHERSHGVATHSLHMKGMAIDIRLPGLDLAQLHQAALGLRGGGVGYYPASDFVHVDVGPLRCW